MGTAANIASWEQFAGWLLLAQQQQPGAAPWWSSLMPMAVILVLFYILMMRPHARRQQERQTMLDALKKNDRVLTAGGVVGVVTNIRKDAGEVTIRTHEDTKLDVARGFITQVLTDEAIPTEEPTV